MEKTAAAAKTALRLFPHSVPPRMVLASLLVRLGGEARMAEAITVLTDGIGSALNDDQRLMLEEQLGSIRGAAAAAAARKQVEDLVEPAMNRVRDAVKRLGDESDRSAVRDALQVVREAIADVSQGFNMARTAGLTGEQGQLESALAQLRRLERQLASSEEE